MFVIWVLAGIVLAATLGALLQAGRGT